MKRTLYTLLGIMLCTGAWAQTLQEQINNAEAGTTVTLSGDVTLEARVDINKNLTVDLGNHTITTTATCGNGSAFNIVSGTVTIQNGTIDASFGEANSGETDAITARSGSDVTLKDLNITVKSKNGACAYAFEGSHITIESGVYKNLTTEQYDWNPNFKALIVNQANVATKLITILGGTFVGQDPSAGDDSGLSNTFLPANLATQKNADGNFVIVNAVAKIGDKGYATLANAIAAVPTDGTETTITMLANDELGKTTLTIDAAKNITLDLNGKEVIEGTSGKIDNKATLTIKSSVYGGKITRSGGGYAVCNYAGANLTLESGTIELTGAPLVNGALDNKGTLTINGGEVIARKYAVYISAGAETNINGGNITSSETSAVYLGGGSCEITGGTLNPADGFVQVTLFKGELKAPESITNNSNATFTSAKPGYVYALAGAISLVQNGEEITLLKDINATAPTAFDNNNSITLNLNGHNFTSTKTAIKVTKGTLTITGEGLVKGASQNAIGTTDPCSAVWANGGSVIINSGTFDEGGVDGSGNSTIFINKAGTITINGGTFKNSATYNGKYWTFNIQDGVKTTASIIARGGKFYNFDPANNINDGNSDGNGTNYVPDGYISDFELDGEGNKIYTVTVGQWIAKIEGGVDSKFRFTSLDNAITTANGASKDVTITLLSDATATVNPSENVTIDADGKALTLPTFIVSDGNAPTYAKVINATEDTYMVTTATYNRTGAVGTQWGTVCLPFSFETKPDGYTLYTPSEVTADVLTVNEVSYPVAAGTPVIFYKDNIDEVVITSSNSNIKIGSTPINGSASLSLIGTYESTNITDNLSSIYYINSDLFHQAKVNLTVPAYRAYIKNSAPGAKASVLNILVGDEATSINMVNMENESIAAIYDANGIRLSSPKKGMNIMKLANGKTVKLIIK